MSDRKFQSACQWTNKGSIQQCVRIHPFGNSDHNLIEYIRLSKEPPAVPRTIRRRSYKNFALADFLGHLQSVDWSLVYGCLDVDQAVYTFTCLFRQILDQHAPWICFQERKRFSPWISPETQLLMKDRDKLKAEATSLAKIGKNATEAWNNYKKLRNRLNNKIRYEENQYKQKKISENLDNSEKYWKLAKAFMNWNTNSGSPNQLQIDGQLVSKASDIAAEMNEYFLSKIKNIRGEIKSIPNNLGKCIEAMDGKYCKLEFQHVSIAKVSKLLKRLKSSKSTGYDGLDSYSLKIAAEYICKPVHHIITLSLMQTKFPTSWKYSKIIPLHKKGSRLERQNYRPVSILSPLSKILEKLMFEQIYKHFDANKLFHENLHGFRENRSTETALLTMYDRWARAASLNMISGAVLIDLSSAFDLVDHDLLLKKLKIYGFKEDAIKMIESYLSDRFQAVWIDHILSEFNHCDVGVPQGSNLGPLLFLVYFNDLLYTLDSAVDSYADDTTITAIGSTVAEVEEKLNKDCQKISDWMKANKLKLNPTKTHLLTIGTQKKLATLTRSPVVKLDNVLLNEDPEKHELLLGCKIGATMKWHHQISMVVSKLTIRLKGLMYLRLICPFSVRKTITEGIFNSTLLYCLPLFGGIDKGMLKELQTLQNRAARLVCGAPPRSNRSELFNTLKWLTVNQMIVYSTLVSVFKIRRVKQPEYLARHLCRESRNGRIMVSNPGISITADSFCFRGPSYWNRLPRDLRSQEKIGSFKRLLRNWVVENIQQFEE